MKHRSYRLALLAALALTLAATPSLAARATEAGETEEPYVITLRVVDVEAPQTTLATYELTYPYYYGYSAEVEIWPSEYLPDNCKALSNDPVRCLLGVDTEAVIEVAPYKGFHISYRFVNIDDLSQALGAGAKALAGYYGDTVSLWELIPEPPPGWGVFYPTDKQLTLGKDKSLMVFLRRLESFPVAIKYYNVDSDDGEHIFTSIRNVIGMRDQTVAIQPEDGPTPYGWDVLDSYESYVTLGGTGESTEALFYIRKLERFDIEVIWLSADRSRIVHTDHAALTGIRGGQSKTGKYWMAVPHGWRYTEQEFPTITYGTTNAVVLTVEQVETFPISARLKDVDGGEEIASGTVYIQGVRGERVYPPVWELLPAGWRACDEKQITLGETSAVEASVERAPDSAQTSADSYAVTVVMRDMDTREVLARHTLALRGHYGQQWTIRWDTLAPPDGYGRYSCDQSVWLGITQELQWLLYSIERYPPYTVTFTGVSALDPKQVVDVQTVTIEYPFANHIQLSSLLTVPEGWVLVNDEKTFFTGGAGITSAYTYQLAPAQRYAVNVRFVDADDTSRLIERRAVPYLAPDANARRFVTITMPDGYTLATNPDGDWSYGVDAYGWQTADVVIPVVPLVTGSVTVRYVDAYRPSDVIGTQTVALSGAAGRRVLLYAPHYSPLLACPSGWAFASRHTIYSIPGQTQPADVPVQRKPANARVVALPDGLKTVGANAFRDTSVAHVVVPVGATMIGAGAFADCAALCYADIPDSVTEIGAGAFGGCPLAVIRCAPGSAAEAYALANSLRVATGEP